MLALMAPVIALSVLIIALLLIMADMRGRHTQEQFRTMLYTDYDNMIGVATELARSEVQSAYDMYRDGRLTEDEAKAEAIARVKKLRYGADGSGCFWIDDTDCRLIAHPFFEKQGGHGPQRRPWPRRQLCHPQSYRSSERRKRVQ